MKGRLFIIGTGPGHPAHMTLRAHHALQEADTVLGYETYVKLLGGLLEGKEVEVYPMRREGERARRAVALAGEGRKVAVVSGGDPGVYGMAAPVFEALQDMGWSREEGFPVEVVPGVSSPSACAALLGAPLSGDFAVVSLSDLLTPWEAIARRLEAAAAADFVIVLLNPRSSGRPWQAGEAKRLLLRHRPPTTPVGVVRQAFRQGQEVTITTLGDWDPHTADMATTLIIGNSRTRQGRGFLLTPRAYV